MIEVAVAVVMQKSNQAKEKKEKKFICDKLLLDIFLFICFVECFIAYTHTHIQL